MSIATLWSYRIVGLLTVIALAACVTINVYFPAAAAEQAADRIIQEVWGKQQPGEPPAGGSPQSNRTRPGTVGQTLLAVVDLLIAPARAQDLNVSSPAINTLRASMAARHPQLAPHYQSGAIGLTADGLIAVRDLNAVGLAQRNVVQRLVKEENQDRAALYREIAAANGQPQWREQIQATFARQWIANAAPGWWYQAGDGWRQK